MGWPTPQDYNEAIQNPHVNFADEQLRTGIVERNALGLPQPSSGAFASVYKLRVDDREVAVRCFLHSVSDQQQRYRALSDLLKETHSDLFVNFKFIEDGIRIHNQWFPIVKMDWLNGSTLDVFVKEHVEDLNALQDLKQQFVELLDTLSTLGIAHGDLQHGNIIVCDGKLRLIDYDGVFVPSIASLGSNELGHANYQHPGRSSSLFNPEMDRFSAWIIHDSLQLLAWEPDLLSRVRGGDECLLFRHLDYVNPGRSHIFHLLESNENEAVRQIGRRLRSLCNAAPSQIPALGDETALPPPVSLAEDVQFDELFLVELDKSASPTVQRDLDSSVSLGPNDWPTASQYLAAVRTSPACFAGNLKQAKPLMQGKSVYKQIGTESVVFAVQTPAKRYAIKCFLHDDPGRAEHYNTVDEYLRKQAPWPVRKYFVPFEYIEEGIKVGDLYFPVLKMDLIPAEMPRLDDYVRTGPWKKDVAESLLQQWRKMIRELEEAGIAHCNLEPANVIVNNGRLTLLDYDTLYVPPMTREVKLLPSVQHAELRHPIVHGFAFAGHDRFAAWLIDTALLAWCVDHQLFAYCPSAPGTLLFTAADLANPVDSKAFALLYHSKNAELHNRAKLLYRFLYTPPTDIPPVKAQALPLLPIELIREYRMRKQLASNRTAIAVICAIAVIVLPVLPHAGLAGLVPLIALGLLVRNFLKERTEKAGGE